MFNMPGYVWIAALLLVLACGPAGENGEEQDILCGNDVIDPGEDCDGDDLGGASCEDLGYYEGELACTEECRFDESGCQGYCGDGEINGPEDCDGDHLGGMSCEDFGYYGGELACAEDCAFDESGCYGYCGDGEINGPEDCDGDDLGGMSCEDFGYYGGELACSEDCAFDFSGCEGGYCGDSEINGPEECDGDDLGGESCESLGFYGGGELACAEDCLFDVSGCEGGYCGDSEINGPEDCDGDDLGGMSCEDLGYYEGELACSEDCIFDDSGCTGYCGDGVVHTEHGEVCDDGVNDGVYGCMPDCTDFAPMYCGDGEMNGPEDCDGDDLGGATCESLGYLEGTLRCGENCAFDTSGCISDFSCGETLVDERDGKQYDTVGLGGLCWMAMNLDVGERIDSGDPQVDPDLIEKYCFEDDPDMCEDLGGLYQWHQAMDYSSEPGARGICPAGWRVPTDEEWKDLEIYLGMDPAVAEESGWRGEGVGTALKEGGSSGFEAPLGGMIVSGISYNPNYGYFWTSTLGTTNPWRRCLTSGPHYPPDTVGRWQSWGAGYALSLRCVRD